MRVRFKIRAILIYLSIISFISMFFGLYFISVPEKTSKESAIKKAAVDRWLDIAKDEAEPNQQKEHAILVGSKLVLPLKEKLLNLTWEELSNLYHSYTRQKQIVCHSIERLGKVTDGGWDVCEDSPYMPSSPCLVFSFGVGNDFSFDDAVARRYNCEVHSFDPSMKISDYRRESSVNFHRLGLADFDGLSPEGWNMSTLQTIRKMINHNTTPVSVLKMDIEEHEWKVLSSMLKSNSLNTTNQLLVELHQCDGCATYNSEQLDKEASKERYITALGILKDLYDKGFRIFWEHQNPACRYISKFGLVERSGCCELSMIRTHF